MKALLWKDICLLRRQLRLFIFAVLVFAAIPNGYIQLFAVAYASMLPYNTIALDEQSHWDQLAAMMPLLRPGRGAQQISCRLGRLSRRRCAGACRLSGGAPLLPSLWPPRRRCWQFCAPGLSWWRSPCPCCSASALQRGGL